MDFLDKLHKLEQQQAYQRWKTAHPLSYLAHIFVMIGKEKGIVAMQWQVGFYNENSTMTTFESLDGSDGFSIKEDEEIFQEEQQKILGVDTSRVHQTLDGVSQACHDLQEKKYPAEKPVKKVMVLQATKNHGLIINVTYITQSFKTLNIKIDAETGEIKEEGLHEVFSFDKGDK